VNAVDYLLKPVDAGRLEQAIGGCGAPGPTRRWRTSSKSWCG
jgi:two-component SAPR family response regulator